MEAQVATVDRLESAKKIVLDCKGKYGLWASPERYRHQCWTRDFVIAGMDALLELGEDKLVGRHLMQMATRQKENGQIPILYLDNTPKWLARKIWNSIRDFRVSFMLKRYFSSDGVEDLSPWTRDSEILFVVGMMRYLELQKIRLGGDRWRLAFNVVDCMYLSRALEYVEQNIMKDGLVYGSDWRDTRTDLDGQYLLTNNCLLYEAYRLYPNPKVSSSKAENLKKLINERYWTGTYYRDYPGTDEFDTLGNAFAILYGVASEDRWGSIFTEAEKVDSPYGYRVNKVQLPAKSPEEVAVMKRTNQFGVIWPFVHGFMILAALKTGKTDLAKRQFEKWEKLPGFYEFYDPDSGKGYGSPDQLWSAALYLRVAKAIGRVN